MNARTIRWVRYVLLLAVVAGAWAVVACRRDPSPPPQPPSTAASDTPVRVTGIEKIVWDQFAQDATQLQHYRYIVYVDDEPTDLVGVTCGGAASDGAFPCTATLPKMLGGPHRLQIAIEETDGQKRRSPKSRAILLEVVTPKTPS